MSATDTTTEHGRDNMSDDDTRAADLAARREVLVLWGVWCDIVGHTCDRDPRHVDPHDVFGMACAANPDRIAGRVYASGIVCDTFDDARDLVYEVLDMAVDGRRPRYGIEADVTADMLLADLPPEGAE